MAMPNVQRAVLFESCLYCGGGVYIEKEKKVRIENKPSGGSKGPPVWA